MSENKERITISIEAELLRRIDAVCEKRGEPRSAMIERMLRNDVGNEEAFMRDMENPLLRAVASVLKDSPGMLKTIAVAVGEKLGPEDLARMQETLTNQIQRGKVRQRKGQEKEP